MIETFPSDFATDWDPTGGKFKITWQSNVSVDLSAVTAISHSSDCADPAFAEIAYLSVAGDKIAIHAPDYDRLIKSWRSARGK